MCGLRLCLPAAGLGGWQAWGWEVHRGPGLRGSREVSPRGRPCPMPLERLGRGRETGFPGQGTGPQHRPTSTMIGGRALWVLLEPGWLCWWAQGLQPPGVTLEE